jgi:hypothetical protein
VIDVENRIVSVHAAQPHDLEVTLVDWDSEGADPRSPHFVQVRRDRHPDSALVVRMPVMPLGELAGSDTERAIDLAESQGALAANSPEPRPSCSSDPCAEDSLAYLQLVGLI